MDLRLARLQFLLDRRAELLCSVRLRQNPHNVHEWHKRVKIFEEQDAPEKVRVVPWVGVSRLTLGSGAFEG